MNMKLLLAFITLVLVAFLVGCGWGILLDPPWSIILAAISGGLIGVYGSRLILEAWG